MRPASTSTTTPPSPVIIVPAQFFDGAPGRHVPDGVRRLMVAIVEDAIHVYRRHRRATLHDKRRQSIAARHWFASEDRTYVFSFLRIAEALGLDADGIRRLLGVGGTGAVTNGAARLSRLGTRPGGCTGSSS